jgi:hypothetical protein
LSTDNANHKRKKNASAHPVWNTNNEVQRIQELIQIAEHIFDMLHAAKSLKLKLNTGNKYMI